MKNIYRHTEKGFEKFTSIAIAILGNSLTFIVAFCLVIFWLSNKQFYRQNIHGIIGDIIWSVTFLSLFIIQKTFNRFSASLHLKVNELVSSHEPANNLVINSENKTEKEITELSKEYTEQAAPEKKRDRKPPEPVFFIFAKSFRKNYTGSSI
jgi:low affinity Fe/Cu permease